MIGKKCRHYNVTVGLPSKLIQIEIKHTLSGNEFNKLNHSKG